MLRTIFIFRIWIPNVHVLMNMKLKWDFQNLNSLLPFNEKSCQMNLFLDTIFFGWLADSQQNLLGTEKAINSTIF